MNRFETVSKEKFANPPRFHLQMSGFIGLWISHSIYNQQIKTLEKVRK